jgi:cytochrome c-type biogenesis protein CcmH
MIRRIAASVCALVVALSLAVPAAASVNILALEQQLQCPTCNTPLNVSNAPSALRIKAYIEQKAAAGWSASQIEQSLVQQFGRDILATPPKSGFDLIVWVVPAVLIIAGLGTIPFITRAWARRSRHVSPTVIGASPDEIARLEQELRRRGD